MTDKDIAKDDTATEIDPADKAISQCDDLLCVVVEERQARRCLHGTELQRLSGPLAFSGVEAMEIELCVVPAAFRKTQGGDDVVLLGNAVGGAACSHPCSRHPCLLLGHCNAPCQPWSGRCCRRGQDAEDARATADP